MRKSFFPAVLCLVCVSLMPLRAQQADTQHQVTAAQLESEVRAEFYHAWSAYKQYAWGHDGLKPLSKSYYDEYGVPFYLTAVDALDGLMLMGFDRDADSTRDYLERNLSFDRDVFVNTFEFSSRYLGALIAAYQNTGDIKLYHLAENLGSRLLPAFITPTGMPYAYVNLRTGEGRGNRNTPEGIGSFLLEFGTLTELTNNAKYYNTAKIGLLAMYEARPELGFVGDSVDVTTGEWVQPVGHVGQGTVRYYESLARCAAFFGDQDCMQMMKEGMAAVNAYLLDSTAAGRWYKRVDTRDGKRSFTQSGAAEASFAVALAMSGHLDAGIALQNSCVGAWKHYGLIPELFNYRTMEVISPAYRFDPGIAKSTFQLYLQSGDISYLRVGKELFDAIRASCRLDEGYADLASVVSKKKADRMASDLLSGTLRYLYLLYTPPEDLKLENVAFTAGGHMIRKTW
jgi:ER degradation enhancer, mannosidase alpha-like 2